MKMFLTNKYEAAMTFQSCSSGFWPQRNLFFVQFAVANHVTAKKHEYAIAVGPSAIFDRVNWMLMWS